MSTMEQQVDAVREWFTQPRFEGIVRLHTPREIAEQRGTIEVDYPVAREAAEGFHARLTDLFRERRAVTTFGPYSPGQAVTMKRMGIEGIYVGGWATSAKGSGSEDPGPDFASYPLSQVPDEAAVLVRALLTADRNQHYLRSRMNGEDREAAPASDYRPFIIADADTGHGGDAHVRNLIRRFVEVGVPGYHIEDQRPGAKKCGHQAGKVLVSVAEQIKRLNAARFQLDVMGVPGIIVARTDAESATFIDSRADERDHPYILGATNPKLPSYKAGYVTVLRTLSELGVQEVRGHLLFDLSEAERQHASMWLEQAGLLPEITEQAEVLRDAGTREVEEALDRLDTRYMETWRSEAGLKTYPEAVADAMEFHAGEGESFDLSPEQWLEFAREASFFQAREKANGMGLDVPWDCEPALTPDGYYPIQGGIEYAIAKSLAVAPFADLVWMETKTANLDDARRFAEAVHAKHPGKMLAYNLSPSFNWDTTGMTDEEMKRFPEELGKLGFVFNFITYGGHQIDGLAAEEFASALQQDGMLALARLQRKFRLLESPYRTPQTLVGGPRLDAALMASTGHTAMTKAMGEGSTQYQHLVQTEVPPSVLQGWLERWREHYGVPSRLRVELRPYTPGSELLELSVWDGKEEKRANVIFANIRDRTGDSILLVRDQNTHQESQRRRLMTLLHLFLIHRYKVDKFHFVTPTEDNQKQAEGARRLGLFSEVNAEVELIIVAKVNKARIEELLRPDGQALDDLIRKESAQPV
jgi:isocitrate lyase